MPERTIAPPITNAVDFEFSLTVPEKIILKNGLDVWLLDAGVEEVMMIELVFTAGNSWESRNMIAAATNALLRNGTKSKSALEINEFFEYHGAYLATHCYNETASVTLHGLSKHAEVLLPVLREILTESIFPYKEVAIFKQNSEQRLKVNLLKCDYVANREIDALVFGKNHPYGKMSTSEDIAALSGSELSSYFNSYYQQGEAVIFAAGKLPANVDHLLNDTFGDLQWRPANHHYVLENAAHFDAANRLHRITNDANGVQGAIRLAQPFPSRHHPHYQEVQVLNMVFGGFFGSRLMANIREEKGYTYGIYSFIQQHAGATAWMVSTEAGREVCEAAINETYGEMRLLCDEQADDEELLLVRNYMLGSVLGSLNGPFKIMNRWKGYILTGVDAAKYFNHSVNTIKTISAERLQELANIYLKPERFYDMVVV